MEYLYIILEKEARVAWQPLLNLLGTHTYKLISFWTVGPIHWAMASIFAPWGTTQP